MEIGSELFKVMAAVTTRICQPYLFIRIYSIDFIAT